MYNDRTCCHCPITRQGTKKGTDVLICIGYCSLHAIKSPRPGGKNIFVKLFKPFYIDLKHKKINSKANSVALN